MRRWQARIMMALVFGSATPAALVADDLDYGAHRAQTRSLTPVTLDPYRAASPYNINFVGRNAPNPANNMPNFTLSCDLPNQNLDTYVAPEKDCGCGGGCGSDCGGSSCNQGCGGWNFNFKFGCASSGGCNSCDNGCGSIFSRSNFGCRSSCGNQCGCASTCGGCSNGCAGQYVAPAVAPAPAPAATTKPVEYVEQIGFWFKKNPETKPTIPAKDCDSCPPNGPPPKHTMPSAGSLDCTNCGSLQSEATFIFGSCRQFFGEPTHKWLHGK